MPTWNAIAAFSKECIAKVVHGVLLLYLVVSSALERSSKKRAARLLADAAIHIRLGLLALIIF